MSPVGGKRITLRVGMERQCDAVHAVAKPGRARPVVKHVAKMPAAEVAVDLGPHHKQAPISGRVHGIIERLPKARPSRAAVELGARGEQRVPAACAVITAAPGLLVERAGARPLGGLLAQDGILRRR
jgi:hypothetical protein